MTRDDVLAELDAITARLESLNGERDELYARRLALFHEGRALGVTQKELAEHCGVSAVAVAVALGKEKRQAKAG